jgi:hypothetical protein
MLLMEMEARMPVRRECARMAGVQWRSALAVVALFMGASAFAGNEASAQEDRRDGAQASAPGTLWADAFDDVDGWEVITAEGVAATIFSDPRGREGTCLRLEYRFERGAGFCVLRHPLDLPLPENYRVRFDVRGNGPFEREIAAGDAVEWSSSPNDETPTLTLDLLAPSEIGGVAIEWSADRFATEYDVQLSTDGTKWEPATIVAGGNGGRDYVRLIDAECRAVRIVARKLYRPGSVTVRGIRVLPPEVGESANAFLELIAHERPEGAYPRYFLGRALPWTVVGLPNHAMEALIDTDGAVEIGGAGFRVEPRITLNGTTLHAMAAKTSRRLTDGCLPLPHVRWESPEIALEVSPIVAGSAEAPRLLIRYALTNADAAESREATLDLMFRPFQVLPPWQWLNVPGGVGKLRTWEWNGQRALVNGRWAFTPWVSPEAAGGSTWDGGEIVEHLLVGRWPKSRNVEDPRGLASGALRFQVKLPPAGSAEVVLEAPLAAGGAPLEMGERNWACIFEATRASWQAELGHARLLLPESGRELADTWTAQLGYILVNADGPAIQPGSRTYERSWIRDGALTCTALLQAGHHQRVRTYLDWYAPNQFDSGKIPCVVDHRGPDPVDEHDSTGQFLYLLHKYYRHTRDLTMLERHWPRIEKAVAYLEKLRATRMTPEFRDGPPEKKVLYGLLPESISHEGYSAKPMHSYWDDFFALRGLRDAAAIAELLGKNETAERWRALSDDFRKTLYDSIRLAMEMKNVDYIPGCAELGDFDATSTTVAIEPGGELGRAPEPALRNTFERYLQYFRDRRDGRIEWRDYTPYELRQVGTFVYLGRPEVSHELLDFFFKDRNPPEWRQWAEVVHRDPAAPRFIGDMPHTWVGAGYFVAVRAMFVYEREADGAMVLGAGVRREWLEDPQGVRIEDWSTEYGTIRYAMTATPTGTVLELSGDFEMPPGGLVIRTPTGPIRAVRADGAEVGEINGNEVTLRTKAARVAIEH